MTDHDTITDDAFSALLADRLLGSRRHHDKEDDERALDDTDDVIHALPTGSLDHDVPHLVSWEGAGVIIDAMRARGWCLSASIQTYSSGADSARVTFCRSSDGWTAAISVGQASSFPRAVAMAAYRVFKPRKSSSRQAYWTSISGLDEADDVTSM